MGNQKKRRLQRKSESLKRSMKQNQIVMIANQNIHHLMWNPLVTVVKNLRVTEDTGANTNISTDTGQIAILDSSRRHKHREASHRHRSSKSKHRKSKSRHRSSSHRSQLYRKKSKSSKHKSSRRRKDRKHKSRHERRKHRHRRHESDSDTESTSEYDSEVDMSSETESSTNERRKKYRTKEIKSECATMENVDNIVPKSEDERIPDVKDQILTDFKVKVEPEFNSDPVITEVTLDDVSDDEKEPQSAFAKAEEELRKLNVRR